MEKSGWAQAVEMDGCGVRGWGVMHVIGEKGVVLEYQDKKVTLDELLEMKQQVAKLRERVERMEGKAPGPTLVSRGKTFVVDAPGLSNPRVCPSSEDAMACARGLAAIKQDHLIGHVLVKTEEVFEVVRSE